MSGRRSSSGAATLGAAVVLGLTLLAPTSAATAAGETCRGEAATLVGTASTLVGTEGRDVIVTGRATTVTALGGDDLICVVPVGTSSNVLEIDAGTGNDVVDTTTSPSAYYADVDLGPGADTLDGGPGGDWVDTGDVAGSTTEVDVVRAGAGGDSVTTTGGADVVDLGPDADRLSLAGTTTSAGGSLTGGGDHDTLVLTTQAGSDHAIDLASGSYRTGDATAAVTSFEGVDVTARGGRVTVSGTTGDDQVSAYAPGPETTKIIADLLGGDDDLLLDGTLLDAGSRFDLGAGDDRLVSARAKGSLSIDLSKDQLRVAGDAFPADGVEDAFLMAHRVTVKGDSRDNELIAQACRTTITGGKGDDQLYWDVDYVFDAYDFGCRRSATTMRGGPGKDSFYGSWGDDRLYGDGGRDVIRGNEGDDLVRGGGGSDELVGDEGRDVLVGGGGRDLARGGPGRDRCDAERTRSCER